MKKKIVSIILILLILLSVVGIVIIPNFFINDSNIFVVIVGMFLILLFTIILFAINSKGKNNKNNDGKNVRHFRKNVPSLDKEKFDKKISKTKENESKTIAPNEQIDKKDKKKYIKELEEKRIIISNELKIAEQSFLKNKIDQNTFAKITKEKNSELIKLEAEIDATKKVSLSKEEIRQLEKVSESKKNILQGLLLEKQKKVYELQIAEKNFYKRKIDEETFKKISSDIKSEMISIESKIKSIQKMGEIEKIKSELKLGAKEIAKQKEKSQQRKNENEIFEEDIFSQIDRMVGGLNK